MQAAPNWTSLILVGGAVALALLGVMAAVVIFATRRRQ
jgi:hypothetical protein